MPGTVPYTQKVLTKCHLIISVIIITTLSLCKVSPQNELLHHFCREWQIVTAPRASTGEIQTPAARTSLDLSENVHEMPREKKKQIYLLHSCFTSTFRKMKRAEDLSAKY